MRPGNRLISNAILEACAEVGVALVEQALPAAKDAISPKSSIFVPICADEKRS